MSGRNSYPYLQHKLSFPFEVCFGLAMRTWTVLGHVRDVNVVCAHDVIDYLLLNHVYQKSSLYCYVASHEPAVAP